MSCMKTRQKKEGDIQTKNCVSTLYLLSSWEEQTSFLILRTLLQNRRYLPVSSIPADAAAGTNTNTDIDQDIDIHIHKHINTYTHTSTHTNTHKHMLNHLCMHQSGVHSHALNGHLQFKDDHHVMGVIVGTTYTNNWGEISP